MAKFGLIMAFEALQFRTEATYLNSKSTLGVPMIDLSPPKCDTGRPSRLWELGVTNPPPEKWAKKCVESPSPRRGPAPKVYKRLGPLLHLKPWLRHSPTRFLILHEVKKSKIWRRFSARSNGATILKCGRPSPKNTAGKIYRINSASHSPILLKFDTLVRYGSREQISTLNLQNFPEAIFWTIPYCEGLRHLSDSTSTHTLIE